LRSSFEQLKEATSVVSIRVGQPDPPHVGRVDDRRQVTDEILVGIAQAGVDDHRLLGVQNKGIHR
jgi:hypothetical protein